MAKDLEIKLKLDRSQSKQQAKEHVADAQTMTAASDKMAAAFRKSLSDQQAATTAVEQAKTETVRSQTDRRDAVSQASATKQKAGLTEVGEAGSKAFSKITLTAGDIANGIHKALQFAVAFSDALKEAAEHYRKITGNFVDQRDKLGELAGIMGKPADNKFTLENGEFNKATGFRPDEGLEFRLGFQNSGQQFKGSNMSEGEFNQYEQQAGELAVARKIDPGVVGDLAGTLAGTKDRRGMGDKASEDALGKLNSGLAILGAGKGRNSVLGNQFNMLASASLNEDELKGTFQDSDEVAIVISAMAEKHDASAAEMARAANRGLRDFDGKAAELLKKAGIDAKTGFIKSIKQITPIIEAEARAKGVSVDDALKPYFEDQLTREAIGVGINKGISGGVFENREKVARENQGAAPAQKIIAEAGQGERVLTRKADAGVTLAEAEIGARNSRIELLRKQATEELTREGEIGTTGASIQEFAGRVISLGSFSTNEAKIEDRQRLILERRAKKVGADVSLDTIQPGIRLKTPESLNEYYNASMNQIQKAGGDPLGDGPANKAKGNDKVAVALEKNNELLKENNRLMAMQQGQGGKPTPQPPSIVTPGPARAITR